MNVVWSRRAIDHLVGIREYIAEDSPTSAAKVAATILQAVELLRNQPRIGRPGRILGTRELVIPGTPYVIPYRIQSDTLELLAVFHGRQSWLAKL